MPEDEMGGCHYQLDGHEFEQVLGVGDGQGGQVCCSPWGHKESDMTEQLKNNKKHWREGNCRGKKIQKYPRDSLEFVVEFSTVHV